MLILSSITPIFGIGVLIVMAWNSVYRLTFCFLSQIKKHMGLQEPNNPALLVDFVNTQLILFYILYKTIVYMHEVKDCWLFFVRDCWAPVLSNNRRGRHVELKLKINLIPNLERFFYLGNFNWHYSPRYI